MNSLLDRMEGWVLSSARRICWLNALLVAVILLQVCWRYGFAGGSVALEELQWHLYGIVILFGMAYTQITDSDVRVDVFSSRWSPRSKAWIDLLSGIFLTLPFVILVLWYSVDFVGAALRVNESSPSASGLHWRWLIKAMIPAAFLLLFVATLCRMSRRVQLLRSNRNAEH